MKKIAITLMAITLVFGLYAAEPNKSDTTFRYKGKTVEVQDSVGKIKVKVYEKTAANDSVPYKQLYEGVYADGKSYEKWTVIEEVGLQIPFLNKINEKHRAKKSYRMEPHWAGVGIGFANVSNASLRLNNINGVNLKPEQTNQWFLNLIEKIVPIWKNNIGLTTGLGFSWSRFYLDNNTHFLEKNGVTGVYSAPTGIEYEYSRLRIAYINIPLMLEWQPTFGSNHKLFVTAGVVGGIKTKASTKIKYTDLNGAKVEGDEAKGLNVNPLTLDYMAQVGYGNMSIYAKYSPVSVFQTDKGPDVKAVSLGIMLHF